MYKQDSAFINLLGLMYRKIQQTKHSENNKILALNNP